MKRKLIMLYYYIMLVAVSTLKKQLRKTKMLICMFYLVRFYVAENGVNL